MTIREDLDFWLEDSRGYTLSLEARQDQSIALALVSPASKGMSLAFKPTREQWLEIRAVLNHLLDADDVTPSSTVAAKVSARNVVT